MFNMYLALVTGCLVVAFVIYVAFQLLLHPLASFPGPKIAAFTRLYAAYYDVIRRGALLKHSTKLHEFYGDVIRIGPNELHFRSPQAYTDIVGASNFTKDPLYYRGFAVPLSAFGSLDPNISKTRRAILHPLFSRRAILGLEPVLQSKVDALVGQMVSISLSNTAINVFLAFRSATLDMIASYCLNRSLGAIEYPGFQHPFLTGLHIAIPYFGLIKYVPWLIPILNKKNSIWFKLLPPLEGIFEFRRRIQSDIDEILDSPETKLNGDHDTVYRHLLADDDYRKRKLDRTREDLFQEAFALLLGGSDTVGSASSICVFHTLKNPLILHRLRLELDEAWPDLDEACPYSELEKLPYLTAVIKESLRLSHGVVASVPRVIGEHPAVIDGIEVPPMTVVSSSATYVHLNPEMYPDPQKFDPDRWLGENSRDLDLASFGKGPRMCLGFSLAWCELYLILGNLFRKLDMTLCSTDLDLSQFHDFFIPVFSGQPLEITAAARKAATLEKSP